MKTAPRTFPVLTTLLTLLAAGACDADGGAAGSAGSAGTGGTGGMAGGGGDAAGTGGSGGAAGGTGGAGGDPLDLPETIEVVRVDRWTGAVLGPAPFQQLIVNGPPESPDGPISLITDAAGLASTQVPAGGSVSVLLSPRSAVSAWQLITYTGIPDGGTVKLLLEETPPAPEQGPEPMTITFLATQTPAGAASYTAAGSCWGEYAVTLMSPKSVQRCEGENTFWTTLMARDSAGQLLGYHTKQSAFNANASAAIIFDPTMSVAFDEFAVVYDGVPQGSLYRFSHWTAAGGGKNLTFEDYDPLYDPPMPGTHAVRFPAGEATRYSGIVGFEGIRNGHSAQDYYLQLPTLQLPGDVHVGPDMVADVSSLGAQSADGSFDAVVGNGPLGDVLYAWVSYSDPADPNSVFLYWTVFAPPSSGAHTFTFPKLPPSLAQIDPEGQGWKTNGKWLNHGDIVGTSGYSEALSKGTADFYPCGPGCGVRYVSGWGL